MFLGGGALCHLTPRLAGMVGEARMVDALCVRDAYGAPSKGAHQFVRERGRRLGSTEHVG